MTFKSLILFGISAAFFAGCTAKQGTVENKPPVVNGSLVTFSTTYGSYKLQLASVFLWPENLNEDQIADLVKRVNTDSMMSDPFFAKGAYLGIEKQTLVAQWDQIDCVGNYALLDPGQDPIDVDHVTNWIAEKDAKDPVQLKTCIDNQARRDQIQIDADANSHAIAPYIQDINEAIDPDQTHIVNSKSLNANLSQLSITQDDPSGPPVVKVKLAGFLIGNYNPQSGLMIDVQGVGLIPSVSDESFDSSLRLLKFSVPECSGIAADGKLILTGNVYRFALERAPNNGPLASFRGDMNLYDPSGKIVRYGTARLDGFPPQ